MDKFVLFSLSLNNSFQRLIDSYKLLSLTTDLSFHITFDSFDRSKGSGDIKDISMSFATYPNSFYKGAQFSV